MAEHADKSDSAADEENSPRGKARPGTDWVAVKDQFVGILAGIVRWVGLIFALILVLHIVFTIAEANEENSIVSFVNGWADSLTLGFKDMFDPADDKLRVLVNFGIAAVVWLIISSFGAALVRRIGSLGK
ncbi:MAG: hypothetical protein GEU86_13450 [Actinophytocola sp.]|nr:hypothetical protein [Actinophytocola sp.]